MRYLGKYCDKIKFEGFCLYILLEMTQCIGRISKVQGIMHFADKHHRFYLEYRCPNQVIANTNNCARCTGRSKDKIQSSGKYDHGNVNEPIPDHSQMYGGKWYTNWCDLWGLPNDSDIAIAEEHRDIARAEFATMEIVAKTEAKTEAKEETKAEFTVISPIPIKRTRKRIQPLSTLTATSSASLSTTSLTPSPSASTTSLTTSLTTTSLTTSLTPSIQPRKRTIKPKPKNEIIIPAESKSIIATHIETKIEELCIYDYEVEYVKLTPFEHNDITYFREPTKNKLFEKKNKAIGAYIGRYDSYTDTIRTDIPDSDNED